MAIKYLDDSKKSNIEYLEEGKPRTAAEYFLPAGLTKYQEKPGERTFFGELLERPSKTATAAIREEPALGAWGAAAGLPAMMGLVGPKAKEKATQAALLPEEVPTFQESQLKRWIEQPYRTDPKTGEILPERLTGAIGASARGMALDIWADPVTMALTLFGLSPGGKAAMGKLGATKVGKELTKLGKTKLKLPGAGKRQVSKEILALQKQFGIDPKLHKAQYTKTKIGELSKQKGVSVKTKADAVKLQAVKIVDDLKVQQKSFDDKILKSSMRWTTPLQRLP